MRILWLSQHTPLPRQINALRRRFGKDVEIDREISSFENAAEVARRFREGGYDDLVVVAPLSVLDHLCRVVLNLCMQKWKKSRILATLI